MTAGGKALPCAICITPLDAVYSNLEPKDGYVQPSEANTFFSEGTYGSVYFDPMDGSYIYINICDHCLEMLIRKEHAILVEAQND
jgi:hypothetical protein